jgi:3D-(3,5/4)-trihydroxycyclohexane-1,2-dione acylhydrolase (decyclizing)
VAETSAGKGTARGEMAVGGIGVNGTHAANALAADADVVVCVGTRLSDFTTGSRALFADPRVRLVGVNVAAADARAAGGLPVVGDARPVLERLADALGGWAAPPTRAAQARAAMDRWRAAVVADVRPRAGERMSQAQVLQRLNAATGPGDWVVAAAGSAPGDILKLWDVPPGGRAHIEFGFSCMGHEIPAGLGIRMAEPGAGRVLVVIGDGTFLMAPTELVTAVELELPVTVIVCVNGGYQSIHSLQLTTTGISLGNEFGVAVDHAALAEALGCPAWSATTPEELDAALQAADAQLGPALIACAVEPRRMALASECWWDLGVAEASTNPRTRELAAAHAAGREAQRYLA